MPVQYSGVVAEHNAVRTAVGIFDVSHMGLARVEGPEARKFLNLALTKNLSTLLPGSALYTLLCRENGNTVDDLIVYCNEDNKFTLVLNAGNKHKDLDYLQTLGKNFNITITDDFNRLSLIAVQGPRAEELLKKLGYRGDLRKTFTFAETKIAGLCATVFVTGYTGELGCEIAIPNAQAAELWQSLLREGESFGIKPAGLAARDTLRTEMGYSLYGHELTEDINPIEAGLAWAVSLDKEFVGKAALEKAKASPQRKLIALKNSSKQAPRPEMKIQDAQNKIVGFITSGTFAPSLGYAIGLGLVEAQSQPPYKVLIRDQAVAFEQTKRPFYKK